MFFNDFCRRRIVSLLRPWLCQEPELELKLGFLCSHVIARNLIVDPSVLSRLLDRPARFCFKDARVDQLSLRVKYWSVPTFFVEVRGFHVTLTPVGHEEEEGCLRPRQEYADASLEDMKKVFAEIDPEGSALHEVLGRISKIDPSVSRTDSLLGVILNRSQLQMHDIHVQVLFPISNDYFACSWEIKELIAESKYNEHGCLFRGLISSIFLPLKVNSFNLEVRGFEIAFKSKDQISHILLPSNVFTCIKYKNLQVIECNISIPEVAFLFSPLYLPILLAFYTLSSSEVKCPRNGRQLWRIASSKISYLNSAPRLSLCKLVDVAILWLRYVHAYESLLLLIGYPVDSAIKRSALKVSLDNRFSRSVKNQWKQVFEFEKKLPAKAVAQARRIARYRASLNVQQGKGRTTELINNHFQKIISGLAHIWNIVIAVLTAIKHFIFLQIFSANRNKYDYFGGVYEDSCQQYYLSLNIGKVLLVVSLANAVQAPAGGKPISDVGTSRLELLSFCLSIDTFFLTYQEKICEHCYFFTCGQLKVMSAVSEDGLNDSYDSYLKTHWMCKVDDAMTILWSEPAHMFYLADTKTCTSQDMEGPPPFFGNIFREMCLNWENSCSKFEGCKMRHLDYPWILCEFKSFLTDQGHENLNCGFWKCSLIVGKLNLVLGYSSLFSIALILAQMQHATNLAKSSRGTRVLSPSLTSEDSPPVNWDHRNESCATAMELAIVKMLPQKYIQIGMFVAGPCAQISLSKEEIHGWKLNMNHVTEDDIHLSFDVDSIEFAVWSTLKSDLISSSRFQRRDAEAECIRPIKPKIIEIPKSDNECYTCHGKISHETYLQVNGLNAYFDGSIKRQQDHIIVLSPTSFQLSSVREDFHSFSTGVVAVSAAWRGVAMGLTFLLYIDELFILVEVVVGLLSAVSHTFSSFDSFNGVNFQELTKKGMVCADFGSEGTFVDGGPLICMSSLFAVYGTFELNLVNVVLHDSRKSHIMEACALSFDTVSSKKFAMHGLSEYGILISLKQMSLSFSCEEGDVELISDISGIRSVIFRNWHEIGKSSSQHELGNLLLHSVNGLYEVFFSHCTFNLWLGYFQTGIPSGSANRAPDDSTSEGNISFIVENSPLRVGTERSKFQSSNFMQKLSSLNIRALLASNKLRMKIIVSEIYMAECSVKNILVEAQTSNELEFSLFVEKEFQTFTCQMQGGIVFLEITALAMFAQCYASYYRYVRNLSLFFPASEEHILPETVDDKEILDSHASQVTQNLFCQVKWEHLEIFTISLSQFSLALVASDESGGLRELLFEADVHLSLKLADMSRKFSFDLFRLSILSQILHDTMEHQIDEIHVPHFSSAISSELSPHFGGDSTVAIQHADGIQTSPDDASCSSHPIPKKESFWDNSMSKVLHFSCQNYILKHLGAFLSVEKPVLGCEISPQSLNQVWVGSGSLSGFDVTISLSEIQILLSAIESLSGFSNNETLGKVQQNNWFSNGESDRSLQEIVPDGAIVAIQDVHQHLYMTVEGVENKYILAGAIHYSLVGERALFRVKYQNQRRWKSSVSWFSLISLHAKNDSGKPLQLNYHPGSSFVDISSTNDRDWALWRILPCKPDSYEGDIELDSYNPVAKNTFYLVNKKIDRAVAFVDGLPEFVSKPGNLFKWKVFHDLFPAPDISLDSSMVKASTSTVQSRVNKETTAGQTGNYPCIVMKIDKITWTIVHELSGAKEKFPLLQGSIDDIEFIMQNLSSKFRIISTLRIVLSYFDARKNSWREFVQPVELSIFYRFRFHTQGSETMLHGGPVNFYARIRELGISITERSLDIVLFVIGKLNLAGPYAIRSSRILANCCKVENHSSLNLLCHFYDKQAATIARKQSSTIVLRRLALVDQHPEVAYVSIELADQGAFSTLPIRLSLLDAGAFAWRTRILSLHDSKIYPGPFVVVDISSKTEDGFSISVSPLLRIQNETEFSMELRFQRPQQKEEESATVVIETGDAIDDSIAAFDAINFSGGLKKALMSLSVGNFLFSFRPEIGDKLSNSKRSIAAEWSDDLKGGKAFHLSGVFDKLSYRVRKAFSVEPVRCSFSTARCSLKSDAGDVADIHFLIQSIGRDIPVIPPDNDGFGPRNKNSPVALQEQREIFLLPTVRISNLLQLEIHVLLTDSGPCASVNHDRIGNQAIIPCGSTVDLYANPAMIYFLVTLTAYDSSCSPVNSGDWVKKLRKQKSLVQNFEIDLDFSGKYFASLRLSRGYRGMLEATIFTSYTLKNDTKFSLFCFVPHQKPLSRQEAEKLDFRIPPERGTLLPPKSTRSWFMKYNKVCLKLLEERASEVLLDLDSLSGLTEISLEVGETSELKHIVKLGLSLGPVTSTTNVPSHVICMVPRYALLNETDEVVIIRQCYLEDDMEEMVAVNSRQKIALKLRNGARKKREVNVFENFLKKHRNAHDDSVVFFQFRPNVASLGWSGPVCIASLGRFFLKFKRCLDFNAQHSDGAIDCGSSVPEFASLDIVEEGSTIVLHYHRPANTNLPYKIENFLREAFITYYQKGSLEPEILGSGSTVNYVWDDLTLPHKLVVQINGVHRLWEINLDKVRAWKPIYKVRQHRRLGFRFPVETKPGIVKNTNFGESSGMEMVNVGYEVYADGPTRVLRICEISDSHKGNAIFRSTGKLRLRISYLAVHLLEHAKQEEDASEPPAYTPIIVTRLESINLDSMFTNLQKYNQIVVKSLSIDQKWVGAPFAAMLRRHRPDYGDTNDNVLHIVLILLSSSSNVKQVKYSSIVLQPLDLNIDEETLMRIVPFWRASLSDPNAQRQQYYFDHFMIHPIKIVVSFLPGDSYSGYSSTQETLRSLLHSVIKIPAVTNMNVELNGVLVTHALITIRELFLKCVQHYSWYAMRAVYIAKGSPLLPPAFASIFDDLASSSLDVFFDPSTALLKLPGLTIGMFKLISKSLAGKGFSGTKRYFGDLGRTVKAAGSNILFAAVTEVSDSVLKGAETSGFNGMVSGFHQGILKLAMEPSLLGSAFMEGGPDRKIMLDRSPGVDELYIEGYLQAMLDSMYKQEYLRVRVIDNQVFLKNLPPNSSLIDEIMDRVKGFLVRKGLLKGDPSTSSRRLRHFHGESEWKLGPTVLTLCEHLFVSFAIRFLRKQAANFIARVKWKKVEDDQKAIVPASATGKQKVKLVWKWGIGKFVLSGMVAYIDGRLCRCIPNPLARRIVSGFLLSFLDKNDNE